MTERSCFVARWNISIFAVANEIVWNMPFSAPQECRPRVTKGLIQGQKRVGGGMRRGGWKAVRTGSLLVSSSVPFRLTGIFLFFLAYFLWVPALSLTSTPYAPLPLPPPSTTPNVKTTNKLYATKTHLTREELANGIINSETVGSFA